MRNFEYAALPAHVVFGCGAARRQLARTVDGLEARRVLVVAAEPEQELAWELAAPFADRVAGVVTDVRPHVPLSAAEAARSAATRHGADTILSVGGGSTTGTAKAIALTTGLPIIAVPTTYAGSEVTPVWGLTDGGRKTTGTDLRVLPRVVVYDPELTLTLPAALSAASGLNALAHCAEAFWALGANPITSLIAAEGVRALAAGLPAVVADPADLEARGDALYGAWLAGTAFATAGSGVHHRICHVLGGAYDLPHAELHAVVLPHATALMAPAVPEADARIAAALGAPDGTPAAEALHELARALGAPTSLRELGLGGDALEDAARLVHEKLSQQQPAISAEDINALLRAAWSGAAPSTLVRTT